MALRLVLPYEEGGDVKDLVVTILSSEYPLKLIELTNYIRKRYGKSVSFQAVRKAAMQLEGEGVLQRHGREFSIRKEWVLESRKFLDALHLKLSREGKTRTRSETIGSEVSIFTFDSLIEMIRAWEDISDVWFKSFKKGDYNVNCYQAPHSWEVLTHPEEEARLMSQSKAKGIRSYILCVEDTPLDRSIVNFHKKIGVKMKICASASKFDKSYYVGTYGDLVLQATYPPEMVKRLDDFFRKNTSIEELDLAELSRIVNAKTKVKMTAIKNLEMARHVNNSIISQMG
ncbi:Uncharacterised protein [uncultured archaeon]|nr:Uncharacterised protein [uncultured archaeon]